VVELVHGFLRFAVFGAGVVVALGFTAQIGAERADDLQPAGAEPAGDQVDAEGLGIDPFADVEAGHIRARFARVNRLWYQSVVLLPFK
jgi:hypothetical protein